jgi:hypothetical protein
MIHLCLVILTKGRPAIAAPSRKIEKRAGKLAAPPRCAGVLLSEAAIGDNLCAVGVQVVK